jgi:DNA-binding winged helix-turn-helix (wHTH) protein
LRYLFEDYAFDPDRRELHRGADAVSIAPQVFDLIDYLIRNRERVVSKDDLINAVWNGRSVSDAALTTRLNVARSAIGDSGEEQRLIKTLPRKGFRFVGQVREARGARAPTFRYAVRRSPRNYTAHPLVPIIVIDAACELVHVAAGRMRLKSFCENRGANISFRAR